MKKEEKRVNKGFVYFLAFMFLGFLLLSSTGVYDNFITGSVPIDTSSISEAISGVLDILFKGFLTPLANIFGGDNYEIPSRLVLGIILFIALNFGIGKKLDNSNNNRNGKIVSLVIAILGASLIPNIIITKLFSPVEGLFGNFIGLILVLTVMILPIYLIARTDVESKSGHFFKGCVYLGLLLIIIYIGGNFQKTSIDIGGIIPLAYALSVLFCLVGAGYSLYKALSHSARAVGEEIENTGGIRDLPKNVAGSARRFWGGNQQSDVQDQVKKDRLKGLIIGNYNAIKSRYGYIVNNEDIRKLNKIISNLKDIKEYSTSINSNIEFSGLKNSNRNLDIIFNLFLKLERDSEGLMKGFEKVRDMISHKSLLVRFKTTIGKTIKDLQGPINNL